MTWEATREYIAEIVRRSLDAGQAVEIEGLGTFRADAEGCRFAPQETVEVFIAYVNEDLPLVRKLCDGLRAAGCSPWIDKEKLLPGQNWPRAIERAIEMADVFIACLSNCALAKRGQFQSELRYALEIARRRPLEEMFIIPARFESCPVPRGIADEVQYVDLFPDWERGLRRVVRAIRKAGRRALLAELDEGGEQKFA